MTKIFRAYHSIAYHAFFVYMVAFLSYIAFGYYNNFLSAFPFLPKAGLFVLTALIVGLIYLFIRHAGYVVNQARQIRGLAGLVWILSFLALFAVSGYGFVTSSMLLFEGPVVARDDISNAITKISDLIDVTKSSLPSTPYATLQANVSQLKGQLHSEIMNVSQGYCGIGPTAKEILDKIGAMLPNIRLITGTDRIHDCKNKKRLTDIAALYDQQIADGLLNSPEYAKGKVPEREALAASVASLLESDIAALDALRLQLGGLTSFIGKIDLYHETVRVLETANEDYMRSYKQLSQFLNLGGANYPPQLQTSDLEQISSGIQVFSTLVSRLDRLTTYLYLIVAFVCDLFAAFAAAAVFREYELKGEIEQPAGVAGTNVQYLWRPEPHPFANRSLANREQD